MKIVFTSLVLIIVFLFVQSMYCYLRKRKERIKSQKVKNKILQKEDEKKLYVISLVYEFLNDMIFLLFKIVGYIPSHTIRKFLYRYVFHMDIGKNVVIYFGLEARSPWNISIGDGTIVGDHAILDARNHILIGKNVNLSTGVWMWTLQHDLNAPDFGTEGKGGAIYIGDRAWISSRTNIMPKTKIEEGVVVAAGAIVTKSLDKKFSVYGGVPAKFLFERESNLTYELNGKHRLFL